MKTIKPLKLGVLTRTFELDRKHYFVPTILVLCDLAPLRRLLPEADLWRLAAAELGKEAVVDECMPKQRGELLVHGHCYTANRTPRTAAAVRVKVGPLDKSLYVIGDRVWRRDGVPGEPAPFTEMPVRYTRAFGGEGYPLNPIGVGFAPVKEDGREVHRMPNIELPKALLQSTSDRPLPGGFGPYDLLWAQRWPKMGTYDRQWMREQLPGLARDMDLTMWNAAPEDQQLPSGFFEGSEEILVENMHPDHPRLEGRLPGIVGRCFVTQRTAEGNAFQEIPMHLDTVQLFPHAARCALSFRGLWRVEEDDADDIVHLLVACDARDGVRPLAHYRDVLARRLDPKAGATEVFRDGDLLPPDTGAGSAGGGDIDAMFELTRTESFLQKNLAEGARREMERTRAAIAAAGGDPDTVPKPEAIQPVTSPSFDDLPDFVSRSDRDLQEAQRKLDAANDKVLADTRQRYAAAGIDYDAEVRKMKQEGAGPPKLSADREMERLRDIQTLCQNANVAAPDLDATLADPKTEARLRQAEEEARNAYRAGAHLAEFRPERLTEPARSELRRRVAEAHAAGFSLARQDLSGADLSGMDLRGIDLTDAFLENAILARANLGVARMARAVLAGADLSEADFSGADLSEANLGATNARNARLDGATLREATLSKADLTGASLHGISFELADLSDVVLDGATLTRTSFDKCILKGNQLRGCDLRESTFVHAILAEVDLRSANLAGARMDQAAFLKCTLDGASLLGADLRGMRLAEPCSFIGADLRGARIEGSTLRETDFTRADFSGATLSSSDLSKCVLREATLYRVVAKNALFTRADFTGASLVAANLEGAILLKTKLARADFKGANLFRADLLRAVGDDRTSFLDANVKQVRVSPRESAGPGRLATVDPVAQQAEASAGKKPPAEAAAGKKESGG
ncbi:DUF2169 family type VI secretion system accessory protein [Chondromyces apiculatus]|uniref:DUF2169 domain-containing protein n=1 Tax=Chondromyces apiculatus DSM 436 TaxID=1192034 RepID=A0A017T934_9BACT|nr:DUF2169 domain-containing protein [Chondromyces apiculatus]EYF05091.1 Hypothetical protein CAP_3681 [Chondromyces apiculatus DSM 436]